MKINKIFFLGLAMLLAACSADDATQEQPSLGILSFSTTIENFAVPTSMAMPSRMVIRSS